MELPAKPPIPAPDAPPDVWQNYLLWYSIQAEAARADAEGAIASSSLAMSAVLAALSGKYDAPTPPETDDALILRLIFAGLYAGKTGSPVLAEAKAQLAAYRAATRPPFQAPV